MYRKPVTAKPCNYTYRIVEYTPRFVGWEVVKLSTGVFEFPPGTMKHVCAKTLENILEVRAQPMYDSLMNYQIRGKATFRASKAGYYKISGKFVRVLIDRPKHIVSDSVVGDSKEGKAIYGNAGLLINTTSGETNVEYVFVTQYRPMDIETFYKYILLYTHRVKVVYIRGDKDEYVNIADRFGSADNTVKGNNNHYCKGVVTSSPEEVRQFSY
jgi:hypothetical protein